MLRRKIRLRLVSGLSLRRLVKMAEKAAKAEQSLSKTCAKLGITTEGKRWLDLALDPFKDLNMPTNGFVDEVELPSVVETIHDSFVVSVPASAGAGLWDANIFIDQLYSSQAMYDTQSFDGNIFGQTGQVLAGARGGIQVRSGPANTLLDQASSTGSLSLKSDVFGNAEVRVIGIGLEIHNTTAELQRQGAIICWRDASPSEKDTTANLCVDVTGTVACISKCALMIKLASPPTTASQAIDLPGSLQWEAKDGAYIVPVLDEPDNIIQQPEQFVALGRDDAGKFYIPALGNIGASKQMLMANLNMTIPFSLSGCFLTGLSNTTTLQVNVTYYVEIFPNRLNVLRRIAQPSPGTDAKALQLYGKIIENLPVGCQVSDNFLGAFISGVARLASGAMKYLPAVGNLISTGMDIYNKSQEERNPLETAMNEGRLIRRIPERITTVEVVKPSERQIVVSNPKTNNQMVLYQPRKQERIVRKEIFEGDDSVVSNLGLKQMRTAKAKKAHRNNINNAMQGQKNGNRWIERHDR